jgi:hypothetical protein
MSLGKKAGVTAFALAMAFVIALIIWSLFYFYYGESITRNETVIVYAISLSLAVLGRSIWRRIWPRKGTVDE